MPWPGLVEPFTECLGLGVLGALCLHRLLHLNPLVFLLVHTLVWFLFDLLLMKLIEVRVLGQKKVFGVVCRKSSTRMGFEPTRAEHNGLAVHRLNHSATLSLLFTHSLTLEAYRCDTLGQIIVSSLLRGVLILRLKCAYKSGIYLGWEKVPFLERCLQVFLVFL